MPRADLIRSEVRRLLRSVPVRTFILSLENRQRVEIAHPEKIAFDPEPCGAEDFYVISGKTRLFSTFDAVSSVSLAERDDAAA